MGDVKQRTISESNTTIFSVKINEKENPTFVGQNDQTIKDAMMKTLPDFSTIDHIFFADFDLKVEGQSKLKVLKAAILPSLLCGLLKNRSQIDIEKLSKKKVAQQSASNARVLSRNSTDQTIFFVKTDRKSKDSIIVLSNADYKFLALCVSADKGDSIKEALEKDGRFAMNIGSWKITNVQANNESPSIEDEAQHFPEAVYEVFVKRNISRKRKSSEGTNKRNDNLQVKIKQEAVDEEDICPPIVKMATSKAYGLLLSPTEANSEQPDKAIIRLVEKQFSKQIDLRRPAWLLEKLCSVAKSVGHIFFEHTTGTCFLVKKDIVMTNRHVYTDIEKQITLSTAPDDRKKIRVWFNHMHSKQICDLREVFVDKVIAISPDLQLDYVLLQLEPESEYLDDLDELGTIVRRSAPEDGLLTIIGHPDGEEKVEECCRVVSPYLWRSNVLQTVQETRPAAVGFDKYLYTCKEQVMSEEYHDRIAYGTNFQHGASGSPCINNYGHVIAMHACGFIVDNMETRKSTSVMEFGISFAAIYEDLNTRHSEDFANELFPELIKQSEMETV